MSTSFVQTALRAFSHRIGADRCVVIDRAENCIQTGGGRRDNKKKSFFNYLIIKKSPLLYKKIIIYTAFSLLRNEKRFFIRMKKRYNNRKGEGREERGE